MKTILKTKKTTAVILLISLLPFLVWSEWLIKTDPNKKKGSTTYKKNSRGFYIPTISQNNYPKASLLRAIKNGDGKTVEISWQEVKPGTNNGTATTAKTTAYGPKINWGSTNSFRYVIYRANSAISSVQELDKATMLKIVNAGVGKYRDTIKKSGTYYYAISVVDSKNFEYFAPEYDQTYTADGVTLGIEPEIVRNIHVTPGSLTNTIQLNWTVPKDPALSFKIFQSTNMIRSLQDKNTAKYLALVPQGTTNFTIEPKMAGKYYYCVVSMSPTGSESTKFIAAQNTLQQPVIVKLEKVVSKHSLPAMITNLTPTYVASNEQVVLSWSYTNQERPGLRIYQNNSPIFSKIALKNSTLLATLPPGSTNTSFTIQKIIPETYYYAITSFDTNNISNESLIANQNSIGYPLIIPKKSYVTNRITYQTNIINLTNLNTMNVTNMVVLTNEHSVYTTNQVGTNTVYVTNTFNLTNRISLTNTQIITNSVTLTNSVVLTNQKTVYLTNRIKVAVKTNVVIPKRVIRYDNTADLRREIRRYYRNERSRSRYGFLNNIMNLKKIALTASEQSVKDQCYLYMGRAYYYLGQYRNAFRIFYSLKNRLPYESRGWINRCLQYMR